MNLLEKEEKGIFVLIRENRLDHLSSSILKKTIPKKKESNDTVGELRDYGVGAQILLDIGVRNMILLSDTQRNIIGLEGYGLSVTAQRPIN